jgi:hypothetical protein
MCARERADLASVELYSPNNEPSNFGGDSLGLRGSSDVEKIANQMAVDHAAVKRLVFGDEYLQRGVEYSSALDEGTKPHMTDDETRLSSPVVVWVLAQQGG